MEARSNPLPQQNVDHSIFTEGKGLLDSSLTSTPTKDTISHSSGDSGQKFTTESGNITNVKDLVD